MSYESNHYYVNRIEWEKVLLMLSHNNRGDFGRNRERINEPTMENEG